MKIDYEKLKAGLESLTGHDLIEAEKAERAGGNTTLVITTTSGFQARLAAAALNVPAPEIKGLPIREFTRVTTTVLNFLLVESDESGASGSSIEGSRSDAPSTEEQNTGSVKLRKS